VKIAAFGALLSAAPLAFAGVVAARWWREGEALADAHAHWQVGHKGWSFPAKIVTDSVPPNVPAEDLVVEAKLRGYRANCRDMKPGDFCEARGRVVPRQGGQLEPFVLGWLVGPEGELREHLPLAEAPRALLDAILAVEDRDFRRHAGVDFAAMLRAMLANAREGRYSQGASTLAMQVVRNLVGRREKTVARKLREAVLAAALDHRLGKDGVLQMYLDAPYLGRDGALSVCGFAFAARRWFDRDVRDLDLAQTATLVAMLPAPGRFDPDRFPQRVRERRDLVLRAMAAESGYDVKEALAQPLAMRPGARPERFPGYLSALRAELEGRVGAERARTGGLRVVAAVNAALQQRTEEILADRTAFLQSVSGRRGAPTLQSAALLMDVDTGAIRAVYAGADASATGFNRATQARRQPGSAFKPVVYAMAFDREGPRGGPAFTAASTEPNQPRLFRTPRGDWSPRNVGGEYTPTASLAYALAWSQNIATASLLEQLGGPRVLVGFAGRLGFETTAFPEEMGLALGQAEVTPLELVRMAAIVANGGLRLEGTTLQRVTDSEGRELVGAPAAGPRVISPRAAQLTRELMRLVMDYGTGGAARGAGDEPGYLGPAMGKTGTTDRERDAWFVGATPRQASVVWLGHDVPESLGAAASDLAAPLWGWWMRRVARPITPYPRFADDPKLARRDICTETGLLAGPGCRPIPAPFLPGTEPRTVCETEHPPKEGDDGTPLHHVSLWKKLDEERKAKEAAPE